MGQDYYAHANKALQNISVKYNLGLNNVNSS